MLENPRERDHYWAERVEFLEAAGYRMPDRLQPNFVPASHELAQKDYYEFHTNPTIMDARKKSDDQAVVLKSISTKVHPHEVNIACFFSSPELSAEPRNHCIPIVGVLQDPLDSDKQIIVMFQMNRIYRPKFDAVGEVVDCLRQIFEGIEFMHERCIAHRDCGVMNLVHDPSRLYPEGFHPVCTALDPTCERVARTIRRAECWPRYFIIDFGLSRCYDPSLGPPLEGVILAGDKSPPEHRTLACNPFPTDIYFLGNFIRKEFLYRKGPLCPSLQFLEPLVTSMTLGDPSLRPTIGEVITEFDAVCGKLSGWALHKPGQTYSLGPIRALRQIGRMMRGVPALPPYTPRADRPVLTPEMRAFYTQIPSKDP